MSNAAATLAGELLAEVEAEGGLADEEPEVEVEEETEAEPEAEPEAVVEELPEDIAYLIENDEEEDDTEFEVAEAEGEWEYVDPEQLRIQAHKAEKKAANLEKQVLKTQRKEWSAEIEKHFRFADPKLAETATSRREALRLAKAEHDLALRGAQAVTAHYEENLDKIVQERVSAELAKVQAAWGTPISGPGPVPAESVERAQTESAIANATSLRERLLLKIQSGNLDV